MHGHMIVCWQSDDAAKRAIGISQFVLQPKNVMDGLGSAKIMSQMEFSGDIDVT
jgi:hypothetical protein